MEHLQITHLLELLFGLHPSNLGYKRANNYITLFNDVIDSNLLTGVPSI